MKAGFRKPSKAIVKIYQHIELGGRVSTDLKSLQKNDIYFAVPAHRPKKIVKLFLWNIWGAGEIYAPNLLQWLCKIASLTPLAETFRTLSEKKINGNVYAPQAIKSGAKFAVVDSRKYCGNNYIYVPNTDEALADLAQYHRRQLDINCIAITGSCGKTTTKELVAAITGTSFRTVSTHASFNTMRGGSHTILDVNKSTQAAVIEVASAGTGSIAKKSKLFNLIWGSLQILEKLTCKALTTSMGCLKKRASFSIS